jgi:dihydrofolate reductase
MGKIIFNQSVSLDGFVADTKDGVNEVHGWYFGGDTDALACSKIHAGDKNVCISSANIMRQALAAGLVDEIHIDQLPVLLGEGVPMFQKLGIEPVALKRLRIVEGTGVTRVSFAVVR